MAKVTKIISNVSNTVIPKDIVQTSGKVRAAIKNGWQTGKRYSQIKDANIFEGLSARSKGVRKELKSLKLNKDDIPAISAIIFASSAPVPGAMLTGYTLGHIIKRISKLFK